MSRVHWPLKRAPLPDVRAAHPTPSFRGRRSRIDWRQYHGHGARYGHMGSGRELPDWEYEDGTPAPHGPGKYNLMFHKHNLLHQFITAGAEVEQLLTRNALPSVPSTAAQRDWDPQVPLYLNDQDERGKRADEIMRKSSEITELSSDINPFEASTFAPLSLGDVVPHHIVDDSVTPAKPVPFWNKRLWALTNEYLMRKPIRNKNALPKSYKS